jgi:hypothetical protein
MIVSSLKTSSAPTGYRFPREVIAVAVRWYLRYALSYRDVEELLAGRTRRRGRSRDHLPIGARLHVGVHRRGTPDTPRGREALIRG